MTDALDSRRDFFISFAGDDWPWARWLAHVLDEEAYSYWFQDQDFHGSIPRSIGEAHANSNRTIVVLSEAYSKSGYCRSEWEMRHQEDPGGARDLLILFRISPCTPDPVLARISYVDLFAYDEANARERVRHRLRQAVEPGYKIKIPLGETVFPGRAHVDAPFPVPPHNLPPPNPDFVGRENVLAAIHNALIKDAAGAIAQAYAITGLGGVGKTQTALAYCYHHLADYRLIWWLRAEPATLATDFMALAGPLGLSEERDRDKAVQAVKAKLQATPGWLLVLDNAEDPATVRPYLPGTGGGHALLTSRCGTDWQGTAAQGILDVMSEPEALQLLAGRPDPDALPTAELAEAKALAEEISYLPLALAQVRAYIAETGESFGGYRALLRTSRVELLGEGRAHPDYPEPVARTWDISIRAAEQQCPAARPLLELLAFFASAALPREVLDAEPEALPEGLRNKLARNRAIGALNRFSLIRAQVGTLTVHSLVQAVVRGGLDEATAKAHAVTALRLVNAAVPHPWEHTIWSAINALLPHALATAEAAERLEAGPEMTALFFERCIMLWVDTGGGYPVSLVKAALKSKNPRCLRFAFLSYFLCGESDYVMYLEDELGAIKGRHEKWRLYEELRAALVEMHLKQSRIRSRVIMHRLLMLVQRLFGHEFVTYIDMIDGSFDKSMYISNLERDTANVCWASSNALDDITNLYGWEQSLCDLANERLLLREFCSEHYEPQFYAHRVSYELLDQITTPGIRDRLLSRFGPLIREAAKSHSDPRVRFDCLRVLQCNDKEAYEQLRRHVEDQISKMDKEETKRLECLEGEIKAFCP